MHIVARAPPPQHKISKQKSNLRFLEKKNIPFYKGPQMRQDGLRVHHVIKEVRKDMPHNRRPGPGSAKKILIIHVFIYIYRDSKIPFNPVQNTYCLQS